MIIEKDLKPILKQDKAAWLQYPVTQLMLSHLDQLRINLLESVAAQALSKDFNHKEWLIKAHAYNEIINYIRKVE